MHRLLLGGLSALLATTISAQPTQTTWRAGIVAFGGPGVLMGGELSRRLPRLGAAVLAIDATVLAQVLRGEALMCSFGCPPPPTRAARQAALSVSASVPLGERLGAVASAGAAVTHWEDTAGPPDARSLWTLGLGWELGGAARMELRAVQLAPGARAERGVRISWHRVW